MTNTGYTIRIALVPESLQPNLTIGVCTSFSRQGWKATVSDFMKVLQEVFNGEGHSWCVRVVS